MGVFWTGMKYVFTDFSCWTSTHGVPHIGMANARWLRIFWFLVVLVNCGLFIWQFISLLDKYLSFSVNTGTTLAFSEQTFPTVTICPLNPWKLSETQAADSDMSSLITAYNSYAASTQYGFSSSLSDERQQTAAKWALMYSENLENKYYTAGDDIAYSYSDVVVSCTYNAATCNQSDFMNFYSPTYGNCLQFNYAGEYTSTRAGPLYGLLMVLKADQATYLPWTETAGSIIVIHNVDETPYPDMFGYFAPPTTSSSLGVSYVSTTRMSSPYGTCTTQTTLTTTHFTGNYSTEACFRSCTQDKIVSTCGCYYPAYSHADNTTQYVSCDDGTIASLNCVDSIISADSTVFDVLTDCNCPQPCQENTYSITVSTSLWPSESYTPTECTSSSTATSEPWLALSETCLEWYQANTLLIEVYYEQMNYQVLTESAAYTFVNFISDVGGQVGLFLGMSIISVIEYLVLIFLLCFYCATHKTRREDLEKLENDINVARSEADRVENRRKNHEIYEPSDNTSEIIPPKPVDNT